MLLVKLIENPDGTIVAETRNKGTLGMFRSSTRAEVVQFLTNKAIEIGEEIRFVDEFKEYSEERVNWEKMIKKHF